MKPEPSHLDMPLDHYPFGYNHWRVRVCCFFFEKFDVLEVTLQEGKLDVVRLVMSTLD